MNADRPEQAVILAGGRGTRLGSLTQAIPKPMVEFHGKPFLEYLLEMLRLQGFEKVLLLLGYLPEKIREYFGDGSRFGLRIEYSISDVDDETGERLRKAAPSIDPIFLLLYCDNYWPMDFAALWRSFLARGGISQIVIYANRDGYSRGNVKVSADSLVEIYDKTRTQPGLQGVDIGYGLFHKAVIDLIPEGNRNFEAALYARLAAEGRLAAFVTEHRYYGNGSLQRFPATEAFLARRPTVLLARDGVLNERPPEGRSIARPEEFRWITGAREAVRRLKRLGFRICVITGQDGIARGLLTPRDLESVHRAMEEDLAEGEPGPLPPVDAIYVCPHSRDDRCECRKPRPGLLFQAQKEFHLDLTRVLLVGEDEGDLQAGRAAGCPTVLAGARRPLSAIVEELLARGGSPEPPSPSLRERLAVVQGARERSATSLEMRS